MWGSQQAQVGRKFTDEDRDGMLAISVLDTLMMFALSALDKEHAEAMFKKWRAHTWTHWQVEEQILHLGHAQARQPLGRARAHALQRGHRQIVEKGPGMSAQA